MASTQLQRSKSAPISDELTSFGEFIIPRLPPDFSRVQMQKIRTNGCVKVSNSSAKWNYKKPWTKDNSSWMGSGFIIAGRIIVTNAHVAEHGKVLTLRKQADGKRYPAKVLAMAEQVDLAFLTVEDEDFWANALELTITDDLVRFQDEVHVVGYPTGGDTVCITEGVVSRIDWQAYSHSWVPNLCIQVDAAINGGNSGGPCLFDGKVCGVAFQGRDDLDNVGHIIPSSILLRMIHEFKTNPSSGIALRKFGEFPAVAQNLENPNMRKFANLPDGSTGVMINSVKKFGWLHSVLEAGDILISIDKNPIGLDGKVEFGAMEGGRIDFRLLISSKLVGEEIEISYVRMGEIQSKTVEIGDLVTMVPISPMYGTYYMFAGLVMIPSSVDLLYSNWKKLDLTEKVLHEIKNPQVVAHQQNILISSILPHEINQGFDEEIGFLPQLVSINDINVYHMHDIVEIIENLKCKNVEWITFRLLNDKKLVFPLQEALVATETLMAENNIVKAWDKIVQPFAAADCI